MAEKLTLGVFMPNYNHSRTIERAVIAIMTQSRKPDRFIIVDDASTDNSWSIIQSLQKRFPLIECIRNPKNLGVIRNFQSILECMGTDLFYPAAADDWTVTDFFETAVGLLNQYPQAGMAFGEIFVCDSAGRGMFVMKIQAWTEQLYANPDRFFEEFVNRESPLRAFGGSTIYRLTVLQSLNIHRFESLGHWYDGFLCRLIGLKYGACYFPKTALMWTTNPESMSQSALKNPDDLRAGAAKTVQWMRSKEFRPLFPEKHVQQWERKYLNFVGLVSNPTSRWVMQCIPRISRIPIVGRLVPVFESWFRKCWLNLS